MKARKRRRRNNTAPKLALATMAAIAITGCNQRDAAPSAAPALPSVNAPTIEPDSAEVEHKNRAWGPENEYGEYLAAPEELANVQVNDIIKSVRMNEQAMRLGEAVYVASCADCHGPDLKGLPDKHTPDLTDNIWRFSGDDLDSVGKIKHPSDVEWTVRYGVRSGHRNARGVEVGMLAFDPQFRSKKDTEDFGSSAFLSPGEISDMVEYVLQIGGQPHDTAMAQRAAPLFQDNTKGNCFDCHGRLGKGIPTFGSTDLTQPHLYLFGSDHAAILESITRGRHGEMPAFDTVLKPEELKAVTIFVFSHATK